MSFDLFTKFLFEMAVPSRNADPIDILRASQKDEQFTDFLARHLSDILRLCGNKIWHRFFKYTRYLSQVFYYGLTSLSNNQTLGEEYAGILRFNRTENNIPNKWIQIIWLLFYIGGDDLFKKGLSLCVKNITSNKNLTPRARMTLLKWLHFLNENKDLLARFNQTAFYLTGNYYHISNRLTGIQYVFLRRWMGDQGSTKAFTILGRVSLLYLTFAIIKKLYDASSQQISPETFSETHEDDNDTDTSQRDCFICAQPLSYTSALPCGHIFCWKCCFKCVSHHGSKCPICREPFKRSRVILLQNY